MDKAKMAARLKAARGKRNREEVAAAVGISPSAIGMYEIGARIPRDDVKIRLANYYGVPVQDLFY